MNNEHQLIHKCWTPAYSQAWAPAYSWAPSTSLFMSIEHQLLFMSMEHQLIHKHQAQASSRASSTSLFMRSVLNFQVTKLLSSDTCSTSFDFLFLHKSFCFGAFLIFFYFCCLFGVRWLRSLAISWDWSWIQSLFLHLNKDQKLSRLWLINI